MKPRSDEDAEKSFLANIARQRQLVQTKGGYIVIDVPVDPYDIPLDRCTTYRQALDWITHIAEKNWATVEILDLFSLRAKAHIDELHRKSGKPIE